MNSPTSSEITRRGLLAASATAVGVEWTVGSTRGQRDGVVTASMSSGRSAADMLLHEDFESTEPGSYPRDWIPLGNSAQEVVATDDAAEGDRCLRMEGKSGACWEALADVGVSLPPSTPVRISAWVGPVDSGSTGCHDHSAKLALRTATGSWDAGQGLSLFRFSTDGTIVATDGTDLGPYEWNEWVRIDVVYERGDGEVRQAYWVNDELVGEVIRPPRDFETDLSYLRFGSGEYTVFYDAVSVETVPSEDGGAATDGGDDAAADQTSPTDAVGDRGTAAVEANRGDGGGPISGILDLFWLLIALAFSYAYMHASDSSTGGNPKSSQTEKSKHGLDAENRASDPTSSSVGEPEFDEYGQLVEDE